jgi:hypothetical protein
MTHSRLRPTLYRDTAPVASTNILQTDSKVVLRYFVPRLRQHAIKLVPGGQKLRHASLIPAGARTLPFSKFSGPAFLRSATKTTSIAGPLGVIVRAKPGQTFRPLN